VLEKLFSTNSMPTPRSLLLKYGGHPAVQFTHILPSAVWALAIPFQLYPGLRSRAPRLHRISGYVFAMAGLLLMVGLQLIHVRGLEYFKTDFPDIPEHVAMTRFPNVLGWVSHDILLLKVLPVWFTGTLIASICCARSKKFTLHRNFMYRHIGSGIWIAPQRLYVGAMGMFGLASSPAEQKMNFGDGAIFGVFATLLLAEVAIAARNAKPSPTDANKIQ